MIRFDWSEIYHILDAKYFLNLLLYMSNLNYPTTKEYKLPKKNILVISCMDLRLTDNLVDFLHFDNLHNRFDHFILAGASLLCSNQDFKFNSNAKAKMYYWKKALFDHIRIAKQLHAIEDIYIVEHENCAAYKEFLSSSTSSLTTEEQLHHDFASELSQQIKDDKDLSHLHIHSFYIDLRGNVKLLDTTNPVRSSSENQ